MAGMGWGQWGYHLPLSEEEGGLPSVSVAGEAQEYRKACPTLPSALGWQEAQEMETEQGCVRGRAV